MQGQLRLLFGAVLFGTFFGVSVGEIQCQGKDVKLNEKQLEQVKDCLGYHGTTSIWKLPSKDFPLTEDGEEILKDKMITHFTTVVHIEESKSLLEKLMKCVDEHGKNLGTKTDQTCMKFMKFGQCMHDTFMDVCF